MLLGILTDHEAIHVLNEENRHTDLIAVHHKAGRFLSGIDVDDTAELKRALRRLHALLLIRNHADRAASESAKAAYERLAVVRLVFIERGVIEQQSQEITHVVFGLSEWGELLGGMSGGSRARGIQR